MNVEVCNVMNWAALEIQSDQQPFQEDIYMDKLSLSQALIQYTIKLIHGRANNVKKPIKKANIQVRHKER